MENLPQTILPFLQSNPVTMGLAAQTFTEGFYRAVAERDTGALVLDAVAAGMLGIAAAAGLPEIGVPATPEVIAYAAAIGFNLPTLAKVALGQERFWSTSVPIGLIAGGIGLGIDIAGVPFNANAFAKHIMGNLSGLFGK